MEPVNRFSSCEDGDRPLIKKYANFRPNDQVYVRVPDTHEGPYIVAFVDNTQYKLCDEKGNQVYGDRWFKEEELEFYDPFE